MFKIKNSVILLNAVLLSACTSNGGSFDTNSVKASSSYSSSSKDSTAQPKSERRTISSTESLAQPSLGFQTKIPRRNFFGGTGEENGAIGEITPIVGEPGKPLSLEEEMKKLEEEVKKFGYDEDDIIHTHDGKKLHRKREMKFVRSGYFIHLGAAAETKREEPRLLKTGPTGYVYYLGTQPSKAFPTQVATYEGTWDFTTNASTKNKSKYFEGGDAGTNVGATPENNQANTEVEGNPIGHSSKFEVNFSDKTLKGTLTKNGYVNPRKKDEQEITDHYKIEANIHGNRFNGKAEALKTGDPYFGKDSNTVEGGFYGDKAQELAGKFLADDKSIFVVFAGKRDEKGEDKVEKKFDSVQVSLKDLAKSDMDTFGLATHLVIDGVQIALLPEGKTRFADMDFYQVLTKNINGKDYKITVCCNNLDYVKFGTFEQKGKDGHQYLVGERTAVADLPKEARIYRYTGTWNGSIRSKDERVGGDSPSDKAHGTRSIFNVNFADKKIEGKLIANDGLETNPMLTLDGKIEGNGFSGTAKTGEKGFNIDNKSTAGGTDVHLNAKFEGGFYGPQAAELGGIVHSAETNKDKVSITFGGKR
ncbi:TPA: transferrin-binding protein-like solute binding protein [Mannheimia haemolytica]|uniref:transferrin-binding protein-like solute binding protein n=1 Tax=Mannheimia haemolytica TaxID=75985 RepID=UPI00115F0D4D|nr:transferrin-binding protein-like solute binding protein [Mannheimia haemolytica]TRC08445.1 transferrin-binding protein-like solute binding protein [Mannheimia haemolytica]TRC18365.1 transferrin-binding protein-like solute binding protein [Mannheimia haemolytica]HDL1952952.1 transferrin-binding protein-like solute binding protein [Mannheimia haemolytica]HDL1987625.1 transferrin-binding protein-like solute binding protein [Mannheimia haemolytica]HDL2106083.1 transferrin-binding protein-like s